MEIDYSRYGYGGEYLESLITEPFDEYPFEHFIEYDKFVHEKASEKETENCDEVWRKFKNAYDGDNNVVKLFGQEYIIYVDRDEYDCFAESLVSVNRFKEYVLACEYSVYCTVGKNANGDELAAITDDHTASGDAEEIIYRLFAETVIKKRSEEKMKKCNEQLAVFHEELIMKACHPSRHANWTDDLEYFEALQN